MLAHRQNKGQMFCTDRAASIHLANVNGYDVGAQPKQMPIVLYSISIHRTNLNGSDHSLNSVISYLLSNRFSFN